MSTEINQQEIAGLTGTTSAMIAGAAESLGQVFGVSVDLALASITAGPGPAEDSLRFVSEFGGVASGRSWLVLAKSDAASIIKSTPKGAGMSDEDVLGEPGVSVLSEAIGLMVAGAATAISNELGELVDISPPSVSPSPETADESVIATFGGEVPGKPAFKIIWEFDSGLAADLGERWLATHQEPVPTTAAPVEPPASAATPPPAAAPAAP
ncbi:MAG: hypothetical protein GY720_19625, partial [bacterium]|nr:hypothetical protein [bacterium]